jgi:hypothetical protein
VGHNETKFKKIQKPIRQLPRESPHDNGNKKETNCERKHTKQLRMPETPIWLEAQVVRVDYLPSICDKMADNSDLP